MSWLFEGVPFTEPLPQHYGFVYEIVNIATQKAYIGKKLFWFKKTKIIKGKKKRYLSPSDWQTYYGSSLSLQKDILETGVDNFRRTIIMMCHNKGECSYYEAKAQFEHNVLLEPDRYYNEWINCKIHRKHLKVQNECHT